jgi:peptidoglycan/xylan/chitin deacetylase (PgdA/CDA1 family)
MTPSIFSDVEDWYHILDVESAPGTRAVDELPARRDELPRLMDIMAERQCPATCFFIGHTPSCFPPRAGRRTQRGHEIASHSYEHRLVYTMTPAQFSRSWPLARAAEATSRARR